MNAKKRKVFSGFTIIELMIVIIIVAILVAIAYPSYIKYVRKAKRGDAQQLLLNWSINQEIWRSNNPTYNNEGDPSSTNYIIPSNDHYDFELVGTTNATSFILRAKAQSGDDQNNDTARDSSISCAVLELNQSGQKNPIECWE